MKMLFCAVAELTLRLHMTRVTAFDQGLRLFIALCTICYRKTNKQEIPQIRDRCCRAFIDAFVELSTKVILTL